MDLELSLAWHWYWFWCSMGARQGGEVEIILPPNDPQKSQYQAKNDSESIYILLIYSVSKGV